MGNSCVCSHCFATGRQKRRDDTVDMLGVNRASSERKDNCNHTRLWRAVGKKQSRLVRAFLTFGADVNVITAFLHLASLARKERLTL